MHRMPMWVGTRRLSWLWGEEERPRRGRTGGRLGRVVGRCDICGEEIRWGESYHASGHRLAHLRCEWKRR